MGRFEREVVHDFDLVSLISKVDRQQAFSDSAPHRALRSSALFPQWAFAVACVHSAVKAVDWVVSRERGD